MSKFKKISKIYSIFTRNQCKYIIFSVNNSSDEFIYIKHLNNDVKSLLFGKNLLNSISNIQDDNSIECIECSLGSQILGGISYDKGDLITNNFSLEESNQILSELIKEIKNVSICIELF
ncbi:MAG: hypothetical protein ACFFC3_08530 [Candidatus Odinarchaeota archaeon]